MSAWPLSHEDRDDLGTGPAIQSEELNPSLIRNVFVRCYDCHGAGGDCSCGGTGFDWTDTDAVRALLSSLMEQAQAVSDD